jgi:hypothetical protein
MTPALVNVAVIVLVVWHKANRKVQPSARHPVRWE